MGSESEYSHKDYSLFLEAEDEDEDETSLEESMVWAPEKRFGTKYPTIGIHPKYFNSQTLHKTLDDFKSHLEISRATSNPQNKIVPVGESSLDDTTTITLDQQIFVLEKPNIQ
ncbi:unnamed protein product [Rotaria magnacalcarata]|uniref:Uncharacterized protein n=1 Tax=Rotaria magnacalcarata TaxID=392030 RepID=A0A8S3C5T8_9BILA|nr:unnamed protein product [Rotaria magnacalcarata]CAF4513723.1 unnamed protein product [Rotaria magnacalcarata]CAF4848414.1 unnamed protein product [Rotaria magnacalcarata]